MPINSIAFNPDGSKLAACVGQRVLVYQSSDGALLQQLKGHKGNVYTISYSKDGQRLASGGADNCTIIWSEEGKGILKFSHTDSVQAVAYNPVSDLLASCSNVDFGFWSSKEKKVTKHKVSSKVLSASWTSDGQIIAIGLFSGIITLRDTMGNEKVSISRTAPIWTLEWNSQIVDNETEDILAVGCWDKTLSFYQISGKQVNNDRTLDYYPCALSRYGPKGEYILLGGSSKEVTLLSREGIPLESLCREANWIWCLKSHPSRMCFATADNGGNISMRILSDKKVVCKYEDRFAYRDNCTDVVIQHLTTRQRVRIKCKDYVQKILFYNFDVAEKSFLRLRNAPMVKLIKNRVSRGISDTDTSNLLIVAEAAAMEGNFQESAALFVKAGCTQRLSIYL